MGSPTIQDRRVRFAWPDDLDPVWTPQVPELALAADAVSMLMPHAEPYVVASVRRVLPDLAEREPEAAATGHAYVRQEAQHHAQHRRFNDLLIARHPRLARVDGRLARVFAVLRRRSPAFGLAFAAGFETIAFVAARWVDRRMRLLRGGDPTATTMFLWHLAEEVEHKEAAFDLYRASGGGRLRLALGTATAALVLALGSWGATLSLLRAEGRLFSLRSHLRLAAWSVSFVFEALPVMAVSVLPGHHPSSLTNPAGLDHWLDHLDPATSTVPEWALP